MSRFSVDKLESMRGVVQLYDSSEANFKRVTLRTAECPSFAKLARREVFEKLITAFCELENNGILHMAPSAQNIMFRQNRFDNLEICLIDPDKYCATAEDLEESLYRNMELYRRSGFRLAPEVRECVNRGMRDCAVQLDRLKKSGSSANVYGLAYLFYYYLTGKEATGDGFEDIRTKSPTLFSTLIGMTANYSADRFTMSQVSKTWMRDLREWDAKYPFPEGFSLTFLKDLSEKSLVDRLADRVETAAEGLSSAFGDMFGLPKKDPDPTVGKMTPAPAPTPTPTPVPTPTSAPTPTPAPTPAPTHTYTTPSPYTPAPAPKETESKPRVDVYADKQRFEKAVGRFKNEKVLKKYLTEPAFRQLNEKGYREWTETWNRRMHDVEARLKDVLKPVPAVPVRAINQEKISALQTCVEAITHCLGTAGCSEEKLTALEYELDYCCEQYAEFLHDVMELEPMETGGVISPKELIEEALKRTDKSERDAYIKSVVPAPERVPQIVIAFSELVQLQKKKQEYYERCSTERLVVLLGQFLNDESNKDCFAEFDAIISELEKEIRDFDMGQPALQRVRHYISTKFGK